MARWRGKGDEESAKRGRESDAVKSRPQKHAKMNANPDVNSCVARNKDKIGQGSGNCRSSVG